MTPEQQQLLQQAIQLSQENNRMIRAMRRDAAWGKFWGVLKLIIIVAPMVWAWFYLQPYIQKINELYQQTQKVQNFSSENVQDWLKDFMSGGDVQAGQKSGQKTLPTNLK